MELFLEFLVEFVLQVFGDVIVDTFARAKNPVVRTLGYCLFCAIMAAVLSGLSVWVFGRHIVADPSVRLALLCVLPFINGVVMAAVGRQFARQGRERSAYEYFAPAFVFSAIFGAVRYFGAQ